MITDVKPKDETVHVKRYKIQHSIDEYTFPTEATIHDVRFDEKYIHVGLTDQRVLSIPLWWIPTVYNASMEDRKKFKINQSRTMIVWDPDDCGINDEISIAEYLGPARGGIRSVYSPREPKRRVAEAKPKSKKK
ncbi:MAG: DUF2442 domain-containing protein [Chloroflexi bacterium]|nr:DUF2442 domain-containing protein [Chloroflexota bacterium]